MSALSWKPNTSVGEKPSPSSWLQRWIGNLAIRQKIFWVYGFVLGVAATGTILGIGVGEVLYSQATQQLAVADRKFKILMEIQSLLLETQLHQKTLFTAQANSAELKRATEHLIEHLEEADTLVRQLQEFTQKHPDEGVQEFLTTYAGLLIPYNEQMRVLLSELEQLRKENAGQALVQRRMLTFWAIPESKQVDELIHEVMAVSKTIRSRLIQTQANQENARALSSRVILGGLGLSILSAFILLFWMSKVIATPLQAVTRVAERSRHEQDFTLQAPVMGQDEVGSLAMSFNQLVQTVNQLILEQQQINADLLLAKQLADRASQAKTSFLSSMSHELRTPLNGILGYAQLLESDPLLTDGQRKGVRIIYQSGTHLLALITDLLDLAKIEAGRLELCCSDFYLPSTLEGISEICQVRAEQKGIMFVYEPSLNLPARVYGDEKRLRQVLLNLLGNAIKFTSQGGVLFKVSCLPSPASELEATTSVPPYTLLFEVVDTGVGMTNEQLEKLFKPFEQVGSQRQNNEGTGLGLAISQELVQLMGSSIQVVSELGKGSTFRFELRLPSAQNWLQSIDSPIKGKIVGFHGKPRRILLIDDKWENRSLLLQILQGVQFEVFEAANGQDGLTLAYKVMPDLILADLVMPVLDGFEMLRRLRRSTQLKNVPVIATSASVFEADQQKCFEGGANDFLAKPIQVQELFKKLQTHLNLEWIYETKTVLNQVVQQSDPESVSGQPSNSEGLPSEMILPSQDDLKALLNLAMQGNLKGVVNKVNDLEQENARYAAFAFKVRQMTNSFQVKPLKEFLKALNDD